MGATTFSSGYATTSQPRVGTSCPAGWCSRTKGWPMPSRVFSKTETNYTVRIDDARPLGAFEHFYKNNRFGNSDYGTHYVVLGYELKVPDATEPKADDQHSELRWWPLVELLASERVHENTKTYFSADRI
jgi:colanic acid biosynthesis protein WcaH